VNHPVIALSQDTPSIGVQRRNGFNHTKSYPSKRGLVIHPKYSQSAIPVSVIDGCGQEFEVRGLSHSRSSDHLCLEEKPHCIRRSIGTWKKREHRSLVGSRSTITTGLTAESKMALRTRPSGRQQLHRTVPSQLRRRSLAAGA
jgi:hypothetical protein